MPARTAARLSLFDGVSAFSVTRTARRSITSEAGKALEILAHALEYLSDEYAISGEGKPMLYGHLEAITLLMALNRHIYLECPQLPSIRERWKVFLQRCIN